MATRAPSGDPWGYYGQQQTTAPELQEARPEPSHTPDTRPSRTESSTEAMDTDEGQRTSARLLEDMTAQRLQWDHQHLLQENLCRREGPLFQFNIMKMTI